MRSMRNLLLACALCALTGCLDYEEVLALKADGSGTLRIDLTVDLAFSEKLRKLSVPAGEKAPEDADDPYKMLVTKESILKNVQGVEGVAVDRCTVDEPATGKTHVKLDVSFKSLDALRKTQGFADREITFQEKDGKVEALYKIDARFLKEMGLLAGPDDPAPSSDLEKKMRKTVDEATADAGARFTVRFPAKPTSSSGKVDANDEKSVIYEVPKKDAKAHSALAKEPLELKATLPAKETAALVDKKKEAK